MRFSILRAVLVGWGLLMAAGGYSWAQAPYGPPVSPNYARAYRHFVNSPYSYRTLISPSPGYTAYQPLPFGEEWRYREPGYLEQRITPRGYERYQYVPGYGGAAWTPFGWQSYAAPGYPSFSYVPPGPWVP